MIVNTQADQQATPHTQGPCEGQPLDASFAQLSWLIRREAARTLRQSAHGLGPAWQQAIRKSVQRSCGSGRDGGIFKRPQFGRHADAAFGIAGHRGAGVVIGQPCRIRAGDTVNRNKASSSAAGLGGGDQVQSVHGVLLGLPLLYTTYLYDLQGGKA